MAITTFSIPLESFDPLLCFQQFYPQGPGFLETLNPQVKTGRYTVVPLNVIDSFRLNDQRLIHINGTQQLELNGDPLALLAAVLRERSIKQPVDTPFPGGFFGFFSYDFAQQIEILPQQALRDLQIPKLHLDWVDQTAVYDHQCHTLTLASLTDNIDLENLAQKISAGQQDAPPPCSLQLLQKSSPQIEPQTFMAMVEQARKYIAAGDIYQANLSCRFDGQIQGSSLELYRRLR
ncbi:MAG: chorismate-binding protein, partial [Geopsychrobacter sp.]|nr:chorismate-binding protein [Geopsychrobacter sp.]